MNNFIILILILFPYSLYSQETLDVDAIVQHTICKSNFPLAPLTQALHTLKEHNVILTPKQRMMLTSAIRLTQVANNSIKLPPDMESDENRGLSMQQIIENGKKRIQAAKNMLILKVFDLSLPENCQQDKKDSIQGVLTHFRYDFHDALFLFRFLKRHQISPLEWQGDILGKIGTFSLSVKNKSELLLEFGDLYLPDQQKFLKEDLLIENFQQSNYEFFQAFLEWLHQTNSRLDPDETCFSLEIIKRLGLESSLRTGFLTSADKTLLIEKIQSYSVLNVQDFKDALETHLKLDDSMYLSFFQASLEWINKNNQKLSEQAKKKCADIMLFLQLHQDIEEERKEHLLKIFNKL